VRAGRILLECETFYLTEVTRRYPDTRIEEYQTGMNKENYNALIGIYSEINKYSDLLDVMKHVLQIEAFRLIGEISDRIFAEVLINDTKYARNPIRRLLNIDNAYFPGRIMPMEAKMGMICIYGMFKDEKAFNQCIDVLGAGKGISVWTNKCASWSINIEGALDSIPTIFNILGIDSHKVRILLSALTGNTESAFYLEKNTNFLDTFFKSSVLRDSKDILKILSDFSNVLESSKGEPDRH
jgi:hypothetical protein